MSNWTVVSGMLQVEIPFQTVIKERVKDYIDWSIAQVKKYGYDIAGSEGPVEFHVNPQNRSSCWSSERGDSWRNACITIVGTLRDRELNCIVDETKAFLKKFAQFASIDYVNVYVSGNACEETIVDHYYSKLDKFDDIRSYTANQRYHKKLFDIQLHNQHRFFDNLLNFKTCANIAEIISRASPAVIVCLFNNFGLDRVLNCDFDEHHLAWCKMHKVNTDIEKERCTRWFNKKNNKARMTK